MEPQRSNVLSPSLKPKRWSRQRRFYALSGGGCILVGVVGFALGALMVADDYWHSPATCHRDAPPAPTVQVVPVTVAPPAPALPPAEVEEVEAPEPDQTSNARCGRVDVEDMIIQAENQYTNGYPTAALFVMMKALDCDHNVRMYRLAATFACGAHDPVSAKHYFRGVPPEYQAAIEQKCQQEGIALDTGAR
ncbi:MAG TPA: hypothetical protein VH165_32860 [Kofleriaceae bacterium]|nr:hypothetical protein [Kofleriaceae bacterium]